MDGREGMALQGSTHYYLHRGIPGSVAGQPGLNTPQGYRPSSNPNVSSTQPIVRGSNPMGTPQFNVEGGPQSNPPQGFTITVASPPGATLSDPTKKKRGRPRKYAPDGSGASGTSAMSLGLSPSSPNSLTPAERKKRGRPPGSGRKQRLASVGEWMNSSAGQAFMPHVIHVAPGEDIAEKILAFSQQRPRALCIMSGSGGVSSVTLRQPTSSTGTVTFEGRFEILCLSGSYLVSDTGGSRNRTGGVNVSLSSPDGHVIGGAIGGRLVASRAVQVVVCSFVSGSIKGQSNESDSKEDKKTVQTQSDRALTQQQMNNASSSQNMGGGSSWPGSKGVDLKNPNTDIDLANG